MSGERPSGIHIPDDQVTISQPGSHSSQDRPGYVSWTQVRRASAGALTRQDASAPARNTALGRIASKHVTAPIDW